MVGADKPRIGRPPSVPNPREMILDHAARLFAEQGFEATSLMDLSVAAGLSKPAIYNYYASKQAVYDAVILRTLERLVATARAAVAPASAAPDRLRAFMQGHARAFEADYHGFVATLVGFSGMSQHLRGEALALRDAHEGLLREIVAEGATSGAFRAIDSETVARAVLSMLSWMARWFKPGAGKSAAAVADDYCDLLLRGLES